jgi:hypothetical protein
MPVYFIVFVALLESCNALKSIKKYNQPIKQEKMQNSQKGRP